VNIYELVNRCVGQKLSRAEFDQYALDHDLTFAVLCNQIATQMAKNYLQGKLDFDFCDQVMNRVYSFTIDALMEDLIDDLPQPADAIYLAFDQGEYHHPGDDSSVDAAEKYTKPELVRILSEIGATAPR
jgi:hypothetical protein